MSTTATGNYVCDNSSLANFKQWAMAISAAFSAFGWTQTSDTGQVNWSTISSVPGTYVYEVWQAADSLAATLPIIVKIEYGNGSTYPGFRVTVGTSSNGSGTITGQVISHAPWDLAANQITNHGSTTYPSYFSGNAGEMRILMWSQAANYFGVIFGVERSKNSSGVATATYFTVLGFGNYTGAYIGQGGQQSILASGVAAPWRLHLCSVVCDNDALTGNAGSTTAVYPIFPDIGQCGNPLFGFLTCYNGDVGPNTTVTVASLYGGTHTFIALTNGANNYLATWITGPSPAAMPAILMRYE